MLIRIQKRCASVLTALPPSPNTHTHFSQPHIITPVTEPLTANSNNAFNPNYIPKNTKERLALEELHQVLHNSKSVFQLLQNKYLQNSTSIDSDLRDLLDKHHRFLESLITKKHKK